MENNAACSGTDHKAYEEDQERLKHFNSRRRVKGRWNFIPKKYKVVEIPEQVEISEGVEISEENEIPEEVGISEEVEMTEGVSN